MPKSKIIIAFLLLTLLSIPATVFALKQGEPFPALSGTTLEGQDFSINSLKGQPILLKVGTTWCPTCSQQSQEINKLRGFLTENDIKYIEIFIQESKNKVQKFLDRNGHQRPDVVILDQGAIAKDLNIYQIPRLIFINKDYAVYRDGAPLRSNALQHELLQMLTEK